MQERAPTGEGLERRDRRVGLPGREAEVAEDPAPRGEVDEERDDAHRRTAVGAEQRIDLADLADELRASEPAPATLGGMGILGIGDRTGCGAWLALLS